MPRFEEMDAKTSFIAQMETESSPVVLINVFTVEPEDVPGFLRAWNADAAVMKQQPGFISTQLHKGIRSRIFVNYAVWESAADFKRAFGNPEFQAKMRDYPQAVAASPRLFQKVRRGPDLRGVRRRLPKLSAAGGLNGNLDILRQCSRSTCPPSSDSVAKKLVRTGPRNPVYRASLSV